MTMSAHDGPHMMGANAAHTTHAAVADVIVARCLSGAVSPEIALAQILAATGELEAVTRAVDREADRIGKRQGKPVIFPARLREMQMLIREITPGCVRIAVALQHDEAGVVTQSVDNVAESPTDVIGRYRRFFDNFVAESEEASVALYSLGSPTLLRRASAEIVDVLQAWGTLGCESAVLDIGCGIGRLEQLIAPKVAAVCGIDISPAMIDAARRRCGELANAFFSVCSGRDLATFEHNSFDLVLAVDSFPYLHESGMPLIEHHFGEARRVLRSGGHFVVLNFSYRGDTAADRYDVARLAELCNFEVVIDGIRPFTLWDGVAFHLRRRVTAKSA